MAGTTKCPVCNGYKKPWFELCYNCNKKGYEPISQKQLEVIKLRNNAKINFKNNKKFPSHAEIYKNIGKIENKLVKQIFKIMGWEFVHKGWWSTTQTTFTIEIEEDFWDIQINIKEAADKGLRSIIQGNSYFRSNGFPLHIEYKSNITEWGKQIDEFFRQIKRRKILGVPILLTFDPEFEEYSDACDRAGIKLIILSDKILNQL